MTNRKRSLLAGLLAGGLMIATPLATQASQAPHHDEDDRFRGHDRHHHHDEDDHDDDDHDDDDHDDDGLVDRLLDLLDDIF